MRVKHKLLNYHNAYIYQDDNLFTFSLDSVLLANFVNIRLSDKKIVDFCCGNGPISMLLTYRTKANILGVELQTDICNLANLSIKENKMDKQITILNSSIIDAVSFIGDENIDVVVCNPPYFKTCSDSLLNKNVGKSIARHELLFKLEDLFSCSFRILKSGGILSFVHRPERLVEILCLMHKYHFEPKRIRFIYPKVGKDANLILIEGAKNGKSGLKILSPLYVHNDDSEYTEEVKKMFGE